MLWRILGRSLCLVLLWAGIASAALTDAQYTALATDILTTHQSEFAAAVAASDDQAIANAYNLTASPDFWVWRTAVSRDEMLFSPGPDGTLYNVSGTGYLTRTVQELQLFESLFNKVTGLTNPSIEQVRTAAGAAINGGTAPAPANRVHMLAVSRRLARRIEQLLATGTGSTASPGTMGFEGQLTGRDIAHALRGVPL